MGGSVLTGMLHDGLTRRRMIAGGGVAGLAMAAGGRRAFAASENVLKIGFVSPRTGALAGFGQTDGYVLELARKSLAKGLTIGGKTYEVVILDRDSQSDPSRASQLAKTLINSDQVDLMLPISAPETINPVADACEAAGVPCLSTVMPWEAWYYGRGAQPGQPSPFKWTYHFGFGVHEFLETYVSQWSLIPTNRKVGVLYPNDADGNAIRHNLAPLLAAKGFTVVDPGPYEDGTDDFSAQIAVFKRAHCEIFNSFPLPPDFAAFWRQATQQGYARHVKICQVAKTGLFPSDITSLGRLGYNIASAAYWHEAFPYTSSLTGIGGEALANGYENEDRQDVDAAARREPRPARRRRDGSPDKQRPEKQGCGRARAERAEDHHHRRQGRLHRRAGTECLARSHHRHAMGKGPAWLAFQARLYGDRACDRPQRADRRQVESLQCLRRRCPTLRSSKSPAWSSASARWSCWTTSTSPCAATRPSASSVPTAPARRPSSASS